MSGLASYSESQLWANLHERLAGTPGVHELVELQRRVTPLFSLAMQGVEYAADQDVWPADAGDNPDDHPFA